MNTLSSTKQSGFLLRHVTTVQSLSWDEAMQIDEHVELYRTVRLHVSHGFTEQLQSSRAADMITAVPLKQPHHRNTVYLHRLTPMEVSVDRLSHRHVLFANGTLLIC